MPAKVPVVFDRSMFKVEVAMVPTTPLVVFKRPLRVPIMRVEVFKFVVVAFVLVLLVEMIPVEVRAPEINAFPTTANVAAGEVVPSPSDPPAVSTEARVPEVL